VSDRGRAYGVTVSPISGAHSCLSPVNNPVTSMGALIMAASITSILDRIADQIAPTFRTEGDFRALKADIAEVRETFPADVAALVAAETAGK
jgi:hypothetical protein